MFGNFGKMIRAAGEMKKRLPEVQAKLGASKYQADAGGGAVTATVNGRMELVDLRIEPKVVAEGDPTMLEDLVKAAVSAAQAQATAAATEAMKQLTGGLSVPGVDGVIR